jgi:uncharacterized membrane protein YhaH (DUF805 family)
MTFPLEPEQLNRPLRATWFQFRGRASQQSYLIATAALAGVVKFFMRFEFDWGLFVCLAPLPVYIAVTCRRLHDINKSGWWQAGPQGLFTLCLVNSLSPGTGFIERVFNQLPSSNWIDLAMTLFAMLTWIAPIAFVFWLGSSVGDHEANDYGEALT